MRWKGKKPKGAWGTAYETGNEGKVRAKESKSEKEKTEKPGVIEKDKRTRLEYTHIMWYCEIKPLPCVFRKITNLKNVAYKILHLIGKRSTNRPVLFHGPV